MIGRKLHTRLLGFACAVAVAMPVQAWAQNEIVETPSSLQREAAAVVVHPDNVLVPLQEKQAALTDILETITRMGLAAPAGAKGQMTRFDAIAAILEASDYYSDDLLDLALAELVERHIAVDGEQSIAIDPYHSYLASRRKYASAAVFRERFPDLLSQPIVVNAAREEAGWRVYDPSQAEDGAVSARAIPEELRDGIFITTHPACGFSRLAIAAINENTELASALSERMFWIFPPHSDTTAQAAEDFANTDVIGRKAVAYSGEDFPFIGFWGTPAFYVVQDGQLVAHHISWREEDEAENLAWLAEQLARFEQAE